MSGTDYLERWSDAAHPPSPPSRRLRRLARHGFLSLASLVDTRQERTFLRALYCHYVFDDQRAAFRSLLESLLAVGSFVDTATCIDMLRGDVPVDGRYYHLSFDDGFRNVLTNAAPILASLGVPALAFVATAYIDGDSGAAAEYSRKLNYPGTLELLTRDELRSLTEMGVEVGSHTRTHARLSAVSPSQQVEEIAGSKADLERMLEAPCDYISWPYGARGDIDRSGYDAIRDAGYAAAFGAYRGSVVPGETPALCIPRHHFEPQWPQSHVRWFARGRLERAHRCV